MVMHKLHKILYIMVFFIAGMSTAAIAAENRKTVCLNDNQTRIIEIVYTGEGKVPCEVQYTKSEGTQTLWSAQNKEGYCENKAAAFVEKQIGWGWSCDLVDSSTEMKEETME
jgi:hypothetical protein